MKTKVSIVKSKTYDTDKVQVGVSRAFDLIGGLSSFIRKGDKVLLKPNLLSARPPEDGVNTHIEIVRSVARLVKECGAKPFIGDNPGGSLKPKEVYGSSGILSIAREEGIECASVKDIKVVRGFPIPSYFFDCDKIINLPKMKTHSLTDITGAVKNMFGAVSGLNKSECHKRYPKPEKFVDVLIDVFEIVRPSLVLMDGIIAMDGDGPASGRLRGLSLLIASQDSVAVDSVFAHLIGIDPSSVLTTRKANKRGLGEIDLEKIEILGEGIEENLIKDFRLPRSKLFMKLPNSVMKILTNLIKFAPYIDQDLCTKCKICQESCPVSCIAIDDSGTRIDHQKCITCMCCHEVCPHKAVGLKRSMLARVFGL